MKRQVLPIIIVDNKIHRIINLLIITNVNSIVMIEQHNKILTEIITIRKNWKNIGSIHSVIPSPDIKKLPIITLGKKHQYSKKNPHVSSSSSLNTETSKMQQFKSQP